MTTQLIKCQRLLITANTERDRLRDILGQIEREVSFNHATIAHLPPQVQATFARIGELTQRRGCGEG